MSDITTEKQLEHALTVLLRISDKLNATFDLDRLLEALLEEALDLTSAQSGCAGLRTAEGMCCDRFLGAPRVEPAYEGRAGSGWSDWVLTHRTYYLTNEAANDTAIVPQFRERFLISSGMSIPILDGERDVIAFFEVHNKQSGAQFTPEDVKNCLAVAQIASLAIQNGLMYGKLTSLAAFSRSLTMASDLEEILEIAGRHFEATFHRGCVILLPGENGLTLRFRTPEFSMTAKETEAAKWCWEQGQDAGVFTKLVPDARAYYLPLMVRGEAIGVLGLESRPNAWFSHAQRELLTGSVGQSALAIEQGLLARKARRMRFLAESERVQNALLTAISHEVRAPIAGITAAVSGLLASNFYHAEDPERRLLETAELEVNRLHRLMNNLLNVTRLQAGMSRVKLELCDLLDVVGAALEDVGKLVYKRQIFVEIPADLPLVPMDFELITQVLVNLFSNAIKFSSPDQPIHLRSRIVEDHLEVVVADRGIGIPEADTERVFQKFYRIAEASSPGGLGLGLSICKEFVEAHRGRIRLEANPEGGTLAKFLLPVETATFV